MIEQHGEGEARTVVLMNRGLEEERRAVEQGGHGRRRHRGGEGHGFTDRGGGAADPRLGARSGIDVVARDEIARSHAGESRRCEVGAVLGLFGQCPN